MKNSHRDGVVASEERREAVDDGRERVGDRRQADFRGEADKLFFCSFLGFFFVGGRFVKQSRGRQQGGTGKRDRAGEREEGRREQQRHRGQGAKKNFFFPRHRAKRKKSNVFNTP